MIEMVYKGKDGTENDEKKAPKNVRQIGEVGKGKRVYLEDYVVTYLHQAEAAVLLGETWEKDGSKYIFIHGAIKVNHLDFSEEVWEEVYRDAGEYFAQSDILGWAMQVSEAPFVPDQSMNHIFKTHFDREDTVLILHELAEKEDVVFAEENGTLKRMDGYYIYYEKNQSMQEYMIAKNEGKSVEKEEKVADKAIRNFRRLSEKKKDRQEEKTKEQEPVKQAKNPRFLYAASTFLALTILVLGVTVVGNYDKMKRMEQAISDMAQTTEDALAANALVEEEWKRMTEEKETESTEEPETAQEETKETEPVTESPQTETVPSDGNAAAMENGVEQASSSQTRSQQAFYTVKEGDTLADICRMYYGTEEKMEEICAFNGIDNPNHILPGQKIKLP